MMNNFLTSKYIKLLPFVFMAFFMASCQQDAKTNQALGFLYGMFTFLIGTILTGLPAVVLSAVSVSSKKQSIPILAIVFTILYFLFFILMFSNFGFADNSEMTTIFPVISLFILGLSIVLIMQGYKKRTKGFSSIKDTDEADVLDNIISEDNEDELLD